TLGDDRAPHAADGAKYMFASRVPANGRREGRGRRGIRIKIHLQRRQSVDDFANVSLAQPRGRQRQAPAQEIAIVIPTGPRARSVTGVNELRQDRVDRAPPPLSVEHAMMAHTGLHMMTLHVWPQAAAQLLSGERLPHRTDIASLAFDRK